jgi:hypothetical protein
MKDWLIIGLLGIGGALASLITMAITAAAFVFGFLAVPGGFMLAGGSIGWLANLITGGLIADLWSLAGLKAATGFHIGAAAGLVVYGIWFMSHLLRRRIR